MFAFVDDLLLFTDNDLVLFAEADLGLFADNDLAMLADQIVEKPLTSAKESSVLQHTS